MGFYIFWINALVTCLFYTATCASLLAKIKRRWLRHSLALLSLLPPVFFFSVPLLELMPFPSFYFLTESLMVAFWVLLGLVLLYLLVAILIFRRKELAQWPTQKLLLATVVLVAMTFARGWYEQDKNFFHLQYLYSQEISSAPSVSGPLFPLPLEINAAPIYNRFSERCSEFEWYSPGHSHRRLEGPDDQPITPEVVAMLQELQPTLAELRQLSEKEGCFFGKNGVEYVRAFTHVEACRNAAYLLALDARYQLLQGRIDLATQDTASLFSLAEHFAPWPDFRLLYLQMDVDALAVQTLQRLIYAAGKEQVKVLEAIKLNPNFSFHVLVERAFKAEYVKNLDEAYKCSIGVGQVMYMQSILQEFWRFPYNGIVPACLYNFFLADADVEAYENNKEKFWHLAELPYYQCKEQLGAFEDQFHGGLFISDWPYLGYPKRRAAKADARRLLVQTACKIVREHAKTGQFPEKMDALPSNPATGKPMGYLKQPDGTAVISCSYIGAEDKPVILNFSIPQLP